MREDSETAATLTWLVKNPLRNLSKIDAHPPQKAKGITSKTNLNDNLNLREYVLAHLIALTCQKALHQLLKHPLDLQAPSHLGKDLDNGQQDMGQVFAEVLEAFLL